MLDRVKRLGTGRVAGCDSEDPRNPNQAHGRKLGPLAFSKVNGNHLVSCPMRGVQEVACVWQQDEIRDPVTVRDWPIAVRHVPESSNRRAGKELGIGGHRARMIAAERRPFEHRLFERLQLGEIRFAGRDDNDDRPKNGNARDKENQNEGSPLFP